MDYIAYIQKKLKTQNNIELIDNAVKFLGGDYPISEQDKEGFELVDNWINEIIYKWNIEVKNLNISNDKFLGKLESRRNGFTIWLNNKLYLTKRRSTLAHEIAHILSFDTSIEWPEYNIIHSNIEEDFCDKVAMAILLPKTLIDFSLFDLANFDRNQYERIKLLWPEFKVSPWLILKRIYNQTTENSLICILWEYSIKEHCLRIVDSYRPNNIFIPKKDRVIINNILQKGIKTNSSPEIAFTSNEFYQGEDLLEIGSFYKTKVLSTTFPIKTKATTYIIQIFENKLI